MHLSQNQLDKIEEAARHEQFGRFDLAEQCYLEVLRGIDPSDRAARGTILNNLGVNATNALDAEKGIEYFSKAIEQLDGLKGEAILQNAHAHWNIARLHVLQYDPAAVSFSLKALDLYRQYPFTTPVDMADAQLCSTLALIIANRQLDSGALDDTWAAVRAVPFESLNPTLVEDFLSFLLSLAAGTGGAYAQNIRNQARAWADPAVIDAIISAIEEERRNS